MEEAERLADRIVVMAQRRDRRRRHARHARRPRPRRRRPSPSAAAPAPAGPPPSGESVDDARPRDAAHATQPTNDLHALTAWALARGLELDGLEVRQPDPRGRLPGADPMTASSLLLHQLRFDLLTIAPQPPRAVLHPRPAAGAARHLRRASSAPTPSRSPGRTSPATARRVPGIMGLAILTSSFVALTMTVVGPAPGRHPQAPPRHAGAGLGAGRLARADRRRVSAVAAARCSWSSRSRPTASSRRPAVLAGRLLAVHRRLALLGVRAATRSPRSSTSPEQSGAAGAGRACCRCS